MNWRAANIEDRINMMLDAMSVENHLSHGHAKVEDAVADTKTDNFYLLAADLGSL